MKLKLEHLAPYLPYKLMWYSKGLPLIEQKDFNTKTDYNSKSKPVLRPLSDLTKEFWDEFFIEFGGGFKNIEGFKNSWEIEILSDPLSLGYKYLQVLFRHHFDVFGLLKNNLAVNINNLK